MTYTIPLISLDAKMRAIPVRTVEVEADDAFEAVMAACDLIPEHEASTVFATMPEPDMDPVSA
jgi:hypothetical protein